MNAKKEMAAVSRIVTTKAVTPSSRSELGKLPPIECNGIIFQPAIEFETSVHKTARHPVGYQRNNKGEVLYVMPGGGRATEREIRGMA